MTRRHFGALVGLLVTLSACTVAHRMTYAPVCAAVKAPRLDVDRLLRAVEMIESGGRNLPPRWDVNGLAFGVFQCHLPRWVEIGGTRENFGKASAATQRKLVRAEFTRRKFTTLEQVARYWNGGGKAHYAYARKLEKEYHRDRSRTN